MTSGIRHTFVTALLIVASACSRERAAEEAQSNAPITPEIASQDPPRPQHDAEHSMLSAELNAGGALSRYEAHFANEHLTRIDETRARDGRADAGVYEFYAARLLKYEGVGLTRPSRVRLELDMQGRVTTALADEAPAAAEEISAIRARGQLLRSHALAQRATRSHEGARPATPTH